jgi:hypothetical protein
MFVILVVTGDPEAGFPGRELGAGSWELGARS